MSENTTPTAADDTKGRQVPRKSALPKLRWDCDLTTGPRGQGEQRSKPVTIEGKAVVYELLRQRDESGALVEPTVWFARVTVGNRKPAVIDGSQDASHDAAYYKMVRHFHGPLDAMVRPVHDDKPSDDNAPETATAAASA